MTILIVDDDAAIRSVLGEMLQDEGYTVADAAHGQAALAYLASCATLPRLILLDLTMPVMNGWEFREHQLRDPRLSGIPVVIISADGNLRQKAQEIGVSQYLQKPIPFTMLLNIAAQYATPQGTAPT